MRSCLVFRSLNLHSINARLGDIDGCRAPGSDRKLGNRFVEYRFDLLPLGEIGISSTVSASAMRERWQRQGTASVHINARRFCRANPASNSEVCM